MAQYDLDSSDGIQQVSIVSITSAVDEFATFVAMAREAAIGNNKSMMSIVNTSGSSVKIKIRELYIVNSKTTAVTGVVSDFEIRRCVSHSAGTSITPQAYDTSDTIDSNVTVRTGATIGTESASMLKRLEWSSDEWGVGTLDNEGSDHSRQLGINILAQAKGCKPLTLRANEGITIKHVINSTAGAFDIICVFTQEAA
jgi:hypothetical protein